MTTDAQPGRPGRDPGDTRAEAGPRLRKTRPFRAIWRQEVRILRHEVDALVILLAMPLILIPVLKEPIGAGFAQQGRDIDGAQFAVVGQAVMFGFFLVIYMGFGVFREHGWHTWDRVLAGPVSTIHVVAGKMVPWMVIGAAQTTIIFGLGVVIWDLSIPASALPGIVLLTLVYVTFLAAFTMLLVAFTDSIMLLQALANLGAIMLGAIGGAMVPFGQLPDWLQKVSPFTPTYWIMRGYNDLMIEGEPWTATLYPAGVVLAFTAFCAILARRRFNPDDVKQFAE